MVQEHFDVVVVGSGFGSLFFVEGYLSKRPAAKILMLERGTFNSHAWQLEQNRNSPIAPGSTFLTDAAKKVWNFTIAVGGGTNCWYAQTPRFHPSDFRMRSFGPLTPRRVHMRARCRPRCMRASCRCAGTVP